MRMFDAVFTAAVYASTGGVPVPVTSHCVLCVLLCASFSLCVHLHVCICVCVCGCICVWIYVCVDTHVSACLDVCTLVCVPICVFVGAHICICVHFVCMCLCLHMCVHVCMCICTCACTCMCMCVCVWLEQTWSYDSGDLREKDRRKSIEIIRCGEWASESRSQVVESKEGKAWTNYPLWLWGE